MVDCYDWANMGVMTNWKWVVCLIVYGLVFVSRVSLSAVLFDAVSQTKIVSSIMESLAQDVAQNLKLSKTGRDDVSLDKFPSDLLDKIFSLLPQNSNLCSVACVSERFKALALPYLYRNIRLEAKFMRESHYSSLKTKELPPGLGPESLSLNLEKHPYLCEYVRELSLKVHNVSWYENIGGHQRLMELLPSLQKISLNPPPKEYNSPMSDRLTTMKLDFSYELGRFWAPRRLIDATQFDLNQYLSKPRLKKLQLEHIEQIYYKPVHTGEPGSSAITDLRFIDWDPGKVGILSSVLPSIQHLTHFVLEANGYWQGGSAHGLAPYDYGLLLQPHSASLEELIIAYSDEAYNDGDSFPAKPTPTMGTLTGYHHLKRLAIPEPFLAGLNDPSFHKLLPSRLEELQIQYPMGVWKPVMDRQGDAGTQPPYRLMRMEKLAKNKEMLVPRLKYVVWWFQQTSRQVSIGDPPPFDHRCPSRTNATRMSDDPRKGPVYGPPEDMDKLAEDFEKVGVKFEWVSMPCLMDTPFGEYARILGFRDREILGNTL